VDLLHGLDLYEALIMRSIMASHRSNKVQVIFEFIHVNHCEEFIGLLVAGDRLPVLQRLRDSGSPGVRIFFFPQRTIADNGI